MKSKNCLNRLKKCAIIIQARMLSSRFPGKMLSRLSDTPLIEYVYRRCQNSCASKILVATSNDATDDSLYNYCRDRKILAMRGSLDNVLERYIQAANFFGVDYIIRVCGDTPFVDISLIDKLLEMLVREKLDYVSFDRQGCASGFYSEAVTLEALKKTATQTNDKKDLEHVTKFIIKNREKFLVKFIDVGLDPGYMINVRLTVDFPEDVKMINAVIDRLGDKFVFSSQDILDIIKRDEFKNVQGRQI